MNAGDLCYINSSGKMVQANATVVAAANTLLGIAQQGLVLDQVGGFLLKGFRAAAGLTTGQILYVGTTAGEITGAPPTASGEVVRVVGYATTASELFFDPDKTWLELL